MTKKDDAAKAYKDCQDETPKAKTGKKFNFPEELALTNEELSKLCQDNVCPQCNQKQDADEQRLRTLADLENTKKRLERESNEFRKYAAEKVLSDLLPILDNLDLALSHGSGDGGCKDFVIGVDMTRKLFLDTLEKHGLTAVGEAGEEFSPERHEAVGKEPVDGMEPGLVAKVMQRGYVLNGRLLRAAMVMVSQ